jgi:hypothetical protein
MSNEEFEKRMEFILEQQAQFAVNMQAHDARFTQLEDHVGRLEELVNRLAAATLGGFKDVNAKIDALVDSHIRLTESQAQTAESLKNLIAVVDRYFSERRNGGQEQ